MRSPYHYRLRGSKRELRLGEFSPLSFAVGRGSRCPLVIQSSISPSLPKLGNMIASPHGTLLERRQIPGLIGIAPPAKN